jgi:hypothetical protein
MTTWQWAALFAVLAAPIAVAAFLARRRDGRR